MSVPNQLPIFSSQPVEFTQSSQEVVFIDRGIDDYELLAQGVKPGVEVHLLEADAVAQMTAVLAGRTELKAVHVVSHGAPGCLKLGAGELSLSTIEQHEIQLQSWFSGSPKAELSLYGCNVAAGGAGSEFLDRIYGLTRVNLSASKSVIGRTEKGTYWSLETQRGEPARSSIFSQNAISSYAHSLPVLQTGAGDGQVSVDVGETGSVSSLSYDFFASGSLSRVIASNLTAFRFGSSGSRSNLSSSGNGLASSTDTTLVSNPFTISQGQQSLTVVTEQHLNDLTEGGVRNGGVLEQTYTFTNPGSEAVNLELIRYYDLDLSGSGGYGDDGGGRLVVEGQDWLFQTDVTVGPDTPAELVGLSIVGGTDLAAGNYEISSYSPLSSKVSSGGDLSDLIQGDSGDADELVDIGSGGDIAVARGKGLTIGAGETATLTIYTVFGDVALNQVTQAVNNATQGDIALIGTPQEDQTLTADPSGVEDGDGIASAFSYQWQTLNGSDWIDINGATADSLMLNQSLVGSQVRVAATYTDGQSNIETVYSNATTIENVNDLPTGSFVLAGDPATEGSPVSVSTVFSNSNINDEDGIENAVPTFQWQEGSEGAFLDIDGAISTSFTPDDAQVGKQLRLAVSYTDDQGTDEVVYSDPTSSVAGINDPATGNVVLATGATEDTELTADTSALDDPDGLGNFNYQWQSQEGGEGDFTPIDGATSAGFTPGDDQVGDNLRLVVSYTDGQGNLETITSNTTGQVSGINDAPTLTAPSDVVDVAEDVAPGTVLTTISAADVDGPNPTLSISAGNEAGLFSINEQGEIRLAENAELDFEGDVTRYDLTVTATEASGDSPLTISVPVSFNVTDVSEETDPVAIAWNTVTGIVSSLDLDTENAIATFAPIGRTIEDTDWELQTTGDLNGDGQGDVILRHAIAGLNLAWYMAPGGKSITSEALIGREVPDVNWSIVGTGDLDGDGHADVVLRNQAADQILAWYMDGAGNILSEGLLGRSFGDSNWNIEAMADFNGDGKADMLLRHAIAGQNLLWEMDGATILAESLLGRAVPDSNWHIEGARDFDKNGTIDVLLRQQGVGQGLLWSMADKNTIAAELPIANVPDGRSQIVF